MVLARIEFPPVIVMAGLTRIFKATAFVAPDESVTVTDSKYVPARVAESTLTTPP